MSKTIFLNYAREDRKIVTDLYHKLKAHGFSPWMDEHDLKPGMDWGLAITQVIHNARIFLACLSKRSISKRGFVQAELKKALDIAKEVPANEIFIIPVMLDPCETPEEFREFQAVYLYEPEGFEKLIKGIQYVLEESDAGDSDKPVPEGGNLIISKIELVNIRCFKELKLNLRRGESVNSWVLIIGDNASGKTTLLRSIALGLCSESEAISLMKEVPGGFVRRGETQGHIKLQLVDTDRPSKRFTITTRIILEGKEESEILRQEIQPYEGFSRNEIFVCGYGTHRAFLADASYSGYRAMDAVQSLFDYRTSLQNPEVVLMRHAPEKRKNLEKKLLKLLMLDSPDTGLQYTKRGMELKGPWGQEPFPALSDGYRSTTQWVLDFIGWLVHADKLIDIDRIGGILLLDEIEQHLHPRWQRYIVQRLRDQFPQTQIIATSHTPLTASGLADVENALLVILENNLEGNVDLRARDPKTLAGKRADQVLSSEAFDLVTSRNPGSEKDMDRYASLIGIKNRTKTQEHELSELESRLKESLSGGESEAEQIVEKTMHDALKDVLVSVSPEHLSLEAKKQLREIFKTDKTIDDKPETSR